MSEFKCPSIILLKLLVSLLQDLGEFSLFGLTKSLISFSGSISDPILTWYEYRFLSLSPWLRGCGVTFSVYICSSIEFGALLDGNSVTRIFACDDSAACLQLVPLCVRQYERPGDAKPGR